MRRVQIELRDGAREKIERGCLVACTGSVGGNSTADRALKQQICILQFLVHYTRTQKTNTHSVNVNNNR
ncbi:hypothetical protein UPYG_G00309200 [Umbra pygmaea]|uniref:Uncharacterized protein n=1 Tax=Umbra pygmaea TaxID=75934 RepID=A0ABD0VZ37_UMBPY